jgi:hypothetical protein
LKEAKMNVFPDCIRVKVTDELTGKSIRNVIVLIKLFANHKNNYDFGLPFADEKGIIEISRGWLSKNVDQVRSTFLMDYSSSLEDCQPKFELTLLSGEQIPGLIKAQRLYQESLNISEEQINSFMNSDNYKYSKESKLVRLTGEKTMEVELKAHKVI